MCYFKLGRSELSNTNGNPVVGIVKDDFHEGRDDAWPGAFMQQSLSLLLTHVTEFIRQNKLDCCNEIHHRILVS